jgi:hypothetical protein
MHTIVSRFAAIVTFLRSIYRVDHSTRALRSGMNKGDATGYVRSMDAVAGGSDEPPPAYESNLSATSSPASPIPPMVGGSTGRRGWTHGLSAWPRLGDRRLWT